MTVPSIFPPDDEVRREWFCRIEAEYRSAAYAHHLTFWLIQIGAPHELVEMGLRVVGDELAHAELSAVVHQAAGGQALPNLAPDSLQLHRSSQKPLYVDVLRYGVDLFCLGETVAVRLFGRLRSRCRQPDAMQALDRILKDEVVHRDFGWLLLEWLLSTPWSDELRTDLKAVLPTMIGRIRKSYCKDVVVAPDNVERPKDLDFPDARRAWGLIPHHEYGEAVEETIHRDYCPRFEALGVTWPQYSKEPLLIP
ncbi:MAG: ferritin-like domain-containing protein [Myxococcales bacterium]|nr:ferritin-like domain-containing protein [Myxococcales bacterium]